MILSQFKEESKDRRAKKFPYIPHNDNFGADGSVTGGSDIANEVDDFILSELDRLVEVAREETRVEKENGKIKSSITWDTALSEVESKWQSFTN